MSVLLKMDLESVSSPAAKLRDDGESEQKPADDKVAPDSGSGLGSPSSIKKGRGLKKWRRIPRDASKIGTSSNGSGQVGVEELRDPAPTPTKRASSYAEKQRKSEASLSSPIDAGLTSENGQDQNANSPGSVTSVLKMNYEIPLVVGSSHDKGRMRLGGKNSGKARIQTMKKHRGKESSPASSSGMHSVINGIQSHLDGENGEKVLDTLNQASDGMDAERGILPADEVTTASPEVHNVSNENHVSHEDQDPLAEVMFELQTVQEALEKELFLLTEISKDAGESEPGNVSECTYVGKDHHGGKGSSQDIEVEANNRDLGVESEDLFKKIIEAEVIYTVTSGAANELRSFSLIQATVSEEEESHLSIDTRTYKELIHTENTLIPEATKAEKNSEEISRLEVTSQSRKTLQKLACCAFIQLLLLLAIIKQFVSQSSPNDGSFTPT